jgi:hypothetical protein
LLDLMGRCARDAILLGRKMKGMAMELLQRIQADAPVQQGVNACHLPGAGLLLNTVGSRLTEPEKINTPVCSHAPGLVERSRFAAQLEHPLGADAQGAKQTQRAARRCLR